MYLSSLDIFGFYFIIISHTFSFTRKQKQKGGNHWEEEDVQKKNFFLLQLDLE